MRVHLSNLDVSLSNMHFDDACGVLGDSHARPPNLSNLDVSLSNMHFDDACGVLGDSHARPPNSAHAQEAVAWP